MDTERKQRRITNDDREADATPVGFDVDNVAQAVGLQVRRDVWQTTVAETFREQMASSRS